MQVKENKITNKKGFFSELKNGGWAGVVFVAVLAMAATYIAGIPVLQKLSISPLIVGIILGMVLGNSVRQRFPEVWTPGIIFSAKKNIKTRYYIIWFSHYVSADCGSWRFRAGSGYYYA